MLRRVVDVRVLFPMRASFGGLEEAPDRHR
jgi:hypothetical protein